MDIADSVQETTTGTSTSNITVNGAVSGSRTFGAAIAAGHLTVGGTVPLRVEDDAGNWLDGDFTLASATTLVRTKIGTSSSAGADITLAGAVRKVSLVPTKSWVDSLKIPAQPAFSTVIPLDKPGMSIPSPKTLTGPLTLTMPSSPVLGAQVWQPIIGNGVDTPVVSGADKLDTSADYDIREGIENQFQFFHDGRKPKYVISQVENATPLDNTAPTLSSPTAAANGPNAATGTVTTNEGNGTLFSMASENASETSAAVIASGIQQAISSAGTKTVTVSGLTANTTYRLHHAHRDAAGNVATTATSSASFTTAAAAAVPSTMAAPVITAGDGQISIAWTQPAMNGGTFQDVTFTASTGQTATGTTSPTTMAVPNGTAVSVTGKARNSVGTAANASPASNIVTPAVASEYPRLANLTSKIIESGTGPYSYAADNVAGYGSGGVTSKTRPVSGDASVTSTVTGWTNGVEGEALHGLTTSTTPTYFDTMPYYVFLQADSAGGFYRAGQMGNPNVGVNGTAMGVQNGDLVRRRITNGNFIIEIARAASPTVFTVLHTFAGIPATAYRFQTLLNGLAQAGNFTATGLV
jgi:hypothetical protein